MTLDEARRLDAATALRIDEAVSRADFSAAPLPDFAAALPDPQRVLADLVSRAEAGSLVRTRLRDALANVEHLLDEQASADPNTPRTDRRPDPAG